MSNKKTLVIGATPNPGRYAYKAVMSLKEHGHAVYPFGVKEGDVEGEPIRNTWPENEQFNTVTLYINPRVQRDYYEKVIALNPGRVIFNPGTENEEFKELLEKNGIETEQACTLVLLSVGGY